MNENPFTRERLVARLAGYEAISQEHFAPWHREAGKASGQMDVIARMRAFASEEPGCCDHTEELGRHFTGSALVVHLPSGDVALTLHRKLGMWLQFGGHADGDYDLAAVARREAEEESGLGGLFPGPEWLAEEGLPFDLDIHGFPAREGRPAHDHYDVRYLFFTRERELVCTEESDDVRWFSLQELATNGLADGSVLRLLAKYLHLWRNGAIAGWLDGAPPDLKLDP